MKPNKSSGFTLIELLIAVAIVGILVGVAYPSYTEFVVKSKREEPKAELLRLANLMEQYFIDNRTYTNDMTLLGMPADPYITPSGNHSIDTTVQTANTYTLTATAKTGAQGPSDPSCTVMSVDHTGAKTATTTVCWEK